MFSYERVHNEALIFEDVDVTGYSKDENED